MSITLDDIRAARTLIRGHVLPTPMLPAPKLSELTGAQVFVKFENMQVTNSFKERGARVKLGSLSAQERKRGVIAMSAGNHAQAVAYHAAKLGIPACVVMPEQTPFVKVAATRAYGAEVVLEGETLSEAQTRAETLARERNLTWVHPYDDPRVIAGQATIGVELLAQVPQLDAVVAPVSGGGLLSGLALALHHLAPHVEVWGAEPALADDAFRSLRDGLLQVRYDGYDEFKEQIGQMFTVHYVKKDMLSRTNGPSMRVNVMHISCKEEVVDESNLSIGRPKGG